LEWKEQAMHKTKIHFQQVPLEVVAKILERKELHRKAKEAGKRKDHATGSVLVERPDSKTEPYSVHNVD
jgi:hypothetical protein